jgi:hypothetical protein
VAAYIAVIKDVKGFKKQYCEWKDAECIRKADEETGSLNSNEKDVACSK